MIPQTNESVKFLKKLRPDGPWILTSILPDSGSIATRTFRPEHEDEMFQWIEGFQDVRNIYFTLNSVEEDVYKKPEKIQISELIALHADVDLRIGEEYEEGRARILKTLRGFIPKPSVIIDSGNGYQPIFLLKESVKLNKTLEMAEDYEGYNRQLEIILEGDHCFNIDRIMRLPGTINIPDSRKQKKGRVKVLANVVEWNNVKHALTDFTKAPIKIQSKLGDELAGGGEKVQLSGNMQHLYVDDLPDRGIHIEDSVKVLVIHGTDPDNPGKYGSRSEALFAVVCALVRAKATDDIIAGIIMNRDNKISESVVDKPRPEKYAAKQIQNAREEVDSPELRKLNAKHAVIEDIGGKCKIISEIYEHTLKRNRISYQTFDDFRNRYCHNRVQIAVDKNGNPIYAPLGKWWTTHPMRRQYETIVFAPGRDVSNAYNLWQGFACEAIPGDCSLFLEHISENICARNKEYYDYLLGWMARCIQKPDCQGEVAVVLRGEMGTGKGVMARGVGSLFGRHFLQISDPKHLVGNFNSHLRDCVVLFSDEAFWAGDKKHEAVLKALITEDTLAIEGKGVDLVAGANYIHLIMASNSNWVVPAGSQERRFFVLDVSQEKMQNKPYFAAIRKQLDNGGREALLHYLLTYDISNFEVRDMPKTGALQDQKLYSYSPEESWWFEKLEEGRLLRRHGKWEREVPKSDLHEDYVLFMQKLGVLRKHAPSVLNKFLGRVSPDGPPRLYQKMTIVNKTGQYGEEYTVSERVHYYEFSDLPQLRDYWDIHNGGPFKWQPVLVKDEEPIKITESFV
jgi:hypothetical protein